MNHLLARAWAAVTGSPVHGDSHDQLVALAGLLGVSVDALREIPHDRRLSYRPFGVRKRDGARRQIVAPSSPLKQLQRRLLRGYLSRQPLHEAATAFRRGHSVATHAGRHLGQAMVLTVDLADFFPSTSASRVRLWYAEQGWSGDALWLLMRLSVYQGGLPQGAPTSPALSNLVNRGLDERLAELASMNGARYSRYCDDLAFSWAVDSEPRGFRLHVEDCLARFGYRVQPRKGWLLRHARQRPEITGVVLDRGRLKLSTKILRRMRRLLSRPGSDINRQRLQGYFGFRKMLRQPKSR